MNDQTKKIIQILVIIFFLAATIVVIFSMVSKNGDEEMMVGEEAPDDVTGLAETMTPKEVEAIKKEAEISCEKIKDEIATSTCADGFYSAEATKEKEVNACNLVEDKFLRASCFDATYLAIALGDTPDSSVCDYLSDKDQQIACADEANFRLAYQNQNQAKEYCNKIITEATRGACLNKFIQ